jgi:hypothetical protein
LKIVLAKGIFGEAPSKEFQRHQAVKWQQRGFSRVCVKHKDTVIKTSKREPQKNIGAG